jgi:hypothetical protein
MMLKQNIVSTWPVMRGLSGGHMYEATRDVNLDCFRVTEGMEPIPKDL